MRSSRLGKSPCRRTRRVRAEKKSSTWLSQEACGGVQCTGQRGGSASHALVVRARWWVGGGARGGGGGSAWGGGVGRGVGGHVQGQGGFGVPPGCSPRGTWSL